MKNKLFKYLCLSATLLTIIFLLAIIISIFFQGISLFKDVNMLEFLFTNNWYPTHSPATYGILALIIGSFCVTFGSLVIAVPLGLGLAIYLSEIAGKNTKEILKPTIEVLASIPSVVFGLFGMIFLAPLVCKYLNVSTGLNIFTTSIIIGMMVMPIICSMSEDALSLVPGSVKEASYGLGATKWETIIKVIVPYAKSGIISSIILGFGRAIGETMVVLMVAGGSAQIPNSIFDSVRLMPATIAAEMGETAFGSDHYFALYAISIVLFIITFVSVILVDFFVHLKRDKV